MVNKNPFRKNILINNISKWISFTFALSIILLFLTLVIFIFSYAVKGFQQFGFVDILFQGDFTSTTNKYSFWIPFSITILTSLIAIIIAIPLGVKSAIFIKYRLYKKYRKFLIVIFQVLSGIPSVIFGLFAFESLGKIWLSLFNINPNSIFNGSIMLCFMIVPTIVTTTLDSLNNIDPNLMQNPLALGNTKSRAIYKVILKAAKPGIIVGIILAFSRAIGESMAISMILQAQPSKEIYQGGLFNFLNSSSQTLGAYISSTMFADKDPELIRPLLYSFGFIMLIISMILNMFILSFSRKKHTKKNSKLVAFEQKLYEIIVWAPQKLSVLWEKVIFHSKYQVSVKNLDDIHSYISDRNINYHFKHTYTTWKMSSEVISILLCLSFVTWIIGDILVKGLIGINYDPNLFFLYAKDSTFQSLINTFLVIFVCIIIGFPIALIIAIYLNEYSKNKKIKKIIIFFLDSLGTTPSIIFGMFGLLTFIQTFGWTSNGKLGNSLIAGSLTLIIVILPSFIRLLEQALKNVPYEIRTNSFALGSSKFQTIRKLVLPMALVPIITSIISTIGRILSETAPLYLTAGLSSSKYSLLNRPGTTLTTQIYAQIFSSSSNSIDIQYQAAFMTMIFILCLILIGYVLIPKWNNIKHWYLFMWTNFKSKWIKHSK